MVGVPGKSTGCTTCRRRKIKCDATKPFCQKCTSTGRHCEGYDKFAVFINNTQTGRLRRKRLEEARPSVPAPAEAAEGSWGSTLATTSTAGGSWASTPSGGSESGESLAGHFVPDQFLQGVASGSGSGGLEGSAAWQIPAPMSSRALVTAGFLGRFIDHYLPSVPLDRGMINNHWLEISASMAVPGSALDLAVAALAWSRAGWYMKDLTLTARSRVIYGRALTLVHEALVDPVVRRGDDLYESTTPDVNGFHQHTVGQAKLVQMRGSRSHMSPLAKSLLMDTKWSAMIFALTMRQSSFLEASEWDEPLEDDESLKPDLELARIGLRLGALLERLDRVQKRADSFDKQASLDQIAQEMTDLHQRILDWEVFLSSTLPVPIFTIIDTTTSLPADPSALAIPWPPSYALTFPSLSTATLLLRSWSIRPILLASLLNLSAHVPSTLLSLRTSHLEPRIHLPYPVPLQSSIQASIKAEVIFIGTLITRSADFMMNPARGLMASQNFILPMRVATFVLVGFSAGDPGIAAERDRCIRAYRDLSIDKGLGWARVIGKVSGDHKVKGREVTVPEMEAPDYTEPGEGGQVEEHGEVYGDGSMWQERGRWGCEDEGAGAGEGERGGKGKGVLLEEQSGTGPAPYTDPGAGGADFGNTGPAMEEGQQLRQEIGTRFGYTVRAWDQQRNAPTSN
ncbi:hypothetical protein KVT40_003208 [Elsinoe batatas]|uniref:Zn(2)-C6 fungal-type domain-containing protein n=1 Tax=Elsinoe batatas TaxID=2601811 RepID=A0A8K0L734_9PEZI|nr:hypothetical protein KVT40_003208 [Elsinoe batatas]